MELKIEGEGGGAVLLASVPEQQSALVSGAEMGCVTITHLEGLQLPCPIADASEKAVWETTYIELKIRCEAQMQMEVCNGCTECYLRCSADVPASHTEWEMLQNYIAAMTVSERASLARIEAQDKSVDLGDEVSVSMCRYFDMTTRRCAVYTVRPLVCRLLGHVEWMPCPIEKVPHPIPTPDALALLRSYAELERRTFAEWEVSV